MFHELVVVDPAIVEAVGGMTPIPYIVQTDSYQADEIMRNPAESQCAPGLWAISSDIRRST